MVTGLLHSVNHTTFQCLDLSPHQTRIQLPIGSAVQERLTSDLPISHHLIQRAPSMIDDMCINHEARDTNAEQGRLQSTVDLRKLAKSRGGGISQQITKGVKVKF